MLRTLSVSVKCYILETPVSWRLPALLKSNTINKIQKSFTRGFKSQHETKQHSRRRSLSPVDDVAIKVQRSYRDLLKPLCFTVLISGGSYVGAIIWQYENARRQHLLQSWAETRDSFFGKAGGFRREVNTWWNSLQPGQKVVASLVGVNAAVFIMWRIRPLLPHMLTYFTCSPASKAVCWPMLLSAFSHYSFIHLFANMYVLWSFGPVISHSFGKEQFLATYVSGAMVAALSSYVYKVVRVRTAPSLGASGAIMAILGVVCTTYPNSRLSIAFVDMIFPHSFTAQNAMYALMTLDFAGILFGWRLFDHAAHLGGMLFGIWYAKYGHALIWKKRESLMRRWHTLRESISK